MAKNQTVKASKVDALTIPATVPAPDLPAVDLPENATDAAMDAANQDPHEPTARHPAFALLASVVEDEDKLDAMIASATAWGKANAEREATVRDFFAMFSPHVKLGTKLPSCTPIVAAAVQLHREEIAKPKASAAKGAKVRAKNDAVFLIRMVDGSMLPNGKAWIEIVVPAVMVDANGKELDRTGRRVATLKAEVSRDVRDAIADHRASCERFGIVEDSEG